MGESCPVDRVRERYEKNTENDIFYTNAFSKGSSENDQPTLIESEVVNGHEESQLLRRSTRNRRRPTLSNSLKGGGNVR